VKISRKLEYACRVLAQLGRHQGVGSMVHIDRLAQAESIPSNYLVQILNELRTKGLISSKRGKQGGYALAKSPEQITLLAIVEAVDAELLKASYNSVGESGAKVSETWDSVRLKFVDYLSEITLDSIIEKDDSKMYYI
jgi:Rrf2 family cysteine metabolism transcriptional repressor